jgi:hypothetical protein
MGYRGSWGVRGPALNPAEVGKAHGGQAQVSSWTWEIWLSGMIGGLGKRGHRGSQISSHN